VLCKRRGILYFAEGLSLALSASHVKGR
jgi:hypothetical protein